MRAVYVVGAPADRFWPKVHKTAGCWLWTAARNAGGYGIFRVDGRNVRAHRWAWEDRHGPIPAGLVIDHLCRTPACVNPDHLEVVTQKVNSERGLPGGRSWRRAIPACPAGHAYDESNTYVLPGTGFRRCRACRNERQRRQRARSR